MPTRMSQKKLSTSKGCVTPNALEKLLDKQIWLVVQGYSDTPYARMDFHLLNKFVAQKAMLPKVARSAQTGQPESKLALLIDSGGGIGEAAYQLATVLQRRSGGFTAVIPR
jgi:hypothetical protein